MEELKRLLNLECDRTLSSEQWDELFAMSEEIHLKKHEALIMPGETKPDVYIVKSGIMRGFDFDGDRERTLCFGLPGTIFNSRFCFYRNLPSYYQIEACCDSIVLKITHDDYIGLTDRSHAFAIWCLHYAWSEQFLKEFRESTFHNGSPEERYVNFIREKPAIAKNVSQRTIASYLRLSQEHLCRIKARLFKKKNQ